MKICVVSDSHGAYKNLIAVADTEHPDCIVFCGDGEKDIERFSQSYPDIVVHAVCGNCDFMSDLPKELSVSIEGINFFVCHGHMYKVKYEPDFKSLKERARAAGSDIALFGHTHSAEFIRDGDITLINPGSIGRSYYPSYAVIEAYEGKFTAEIMSL